MKAPLPDDFILFEDNPDGQSIDVVRIVILNPTTYRIHRFIAGQWRWIEDDTITIDQAEKRFRACWDAYQRVIT